MCGPVMTRNGFYKSPWKILASGFNVIRRNIEKAPKDRFVFLIEGSA